MDCVQVFDSSGNYQFQFGTEGSGDGQFSYRDEIAIDDNNRVYVVDRGNDRVQVFQIMNDILLGDTNLDGDINLVDVQPFVDQLTSSGYQDDADINQDGLLDLLNVGPFVDLLNGG